MTQAPSGLPEAEARASCPRVSGVVSYQTMRTLPKVASVLVLWIGLAAACAQWERVPAEERREIVKEVTEKVDETIKAKPAERDWAGLALAILTAIGGAFATVRAARGPATPVVNKAIEARAQKAVASAAAKE